MRTSDPHPLPLAADRRTSVVRLAFRRTLLAAVPVVALLGAGCGDDGDDTTDPTDVVDAADDAANDGGADTDTDTGTDAEDDATPDAGDGDADVPPPECEDGARECTEDALSIRVCVGGSWTEEACEGTDPLLCEDGACVPAWTWGAPEWQTCDGFERDTGTSLADKAAAYDDIAQRLHVHPDLGWAMSVTLRTEEVECPEGVEGPCTAPVAGPEDATWEDVAYWHSGANDGLWSALYLTSQAFRYAVTGSDEALEMVRLMMRSQERRMAITGVEGIFTRAFRPPDMPELPCPSDPLDYVPDVEKDDDRWVRIGDDGCVQTYDAEAEAFVSSTHCGMDEFAGYCFLDNVSQDEYAGHMAALAAVWKFVDDEEIRAITVRLADAIGSHLLDNELTFVDWDGRITEHGLLYPTSLVDSPGFLAAQALGWIKITAEITGREDLHTFYDECLLQRSGAGKCMSWPLENGQPYHTVHLPNMALYIGNDGCTLNFNRLSMVFVNLWGLLEFETDPEIRASVQDALTNHVWFDESSRSASNQYNPWFNYMYAAHKALGPGTDGPAIEPVHEAACSLREFPDDQVNRTRDMSNYEWYCEARLERDGTEHPINVADRCVSTFMWWRSPFNMSTCSDNPAKIEHPGDYLLAYWMGRYYGFLSADD